MICEDVGMFRGPAGKHALDFIWNAPMLGSESEKNLMEWWIARMKKNNRRKYGAFIYQPFINDHGRR